MGKQKRSGRQRDPRRWTSGHSVSEDGFSPKREWYEGDEPQATDRDESKK
ncbi:hypothetical protein [Haladaptatus sp. NG-WS-4]